MANRMLTNNVDDRHLRSTGIVKIRDAVGQTWTKMQQRACWLAKHAGVSVRGSRHYPFEQAEHRTHLRHAVERGNNMHFGRAGVRETGVHSSSHERTNQAFCASHRIECLLLAAAFQVNGCSVKTRLHGD